MFFLLVLISFLKTGKVLSDILDIYLRQNIISKTPLLAKLFWTQLIDTLSASAFQFKKLQLELEENKKFEMLSQIAAQVSHDIRSPLAALNVILGQIQNIPEDKRIVLRTAVGRINDISNDLLEKSKQAKASSKSVALGGNTSAQETTKGEVVMLSSLVDSLVSEKRMQFREKVNIQIEADILHSYGLFIFVSISEFKRTLSNLINNSVEAFASGHGLVTVIVKEIDNNVIITMRDNGKGIPQSIIDKLGTMGVTHGKEGTTSGSGLGNYHAKKTVEDFGGKFSIASKEGVGTDITMAFPKAQAPSWFVEKLYLAPNDLVMVLDDDISIHGIWKGRLSLRTKQTDIQIQSYTSGEEFKAAVKSIDGRRPVAVFLIDYELLNQKQNGLDIIQELNLGKNAILVTSRYEEKYVRERAEKLQVKLIPKSMAGFISIEVANIETETKKTTPGLNNKITTTILIDDDDLIRLVWGEAAKSKKMPFEAHANADEVLGKLDNYSIDSTFYIDSNLKNDVKGEDVAKKLYDNGFTNLYLATGYEPEHFAHLKFIKGVQGKVAPF